MILTVKSSDGDGNIGVVGFDAKGELMAVVRWDLFVTIVSATAKLFKFEMLLSHNAGNAVWDIPTFPRSAFVLYKM